MAHAFSQAADVGTAWLAEQLKKKQEFFEVAFTGRHLVDLALPAAAWGKNIGHAK